MQSKIITLLIFISFHVCIYAQTDRRIALIVGNSEYIHENDLGNAEHDARALSSKLDELGFDVIPKFNLNKQELEDAIVMFAEKAFEYDVALFYYAGHGAQHNGRNYLIPTGANIRFPSEMEYDCTDAGRVLSMLDESGCKMKIMILDACRIVKQHKYMRGDGAKGLAEMKASTGTFIAYSTGPGHLAYDGGAEQYHSPYAAALLKTLDKPGLNILDVFQEVLDQVAIETQEQQIPWTSSSFRGRFYFNVESVDDNLMYPAQEFIESQEYVFADNHQLIEASLAVDLGLPSGTLWAGFNIGASKPYEYGKYFSWGEHKEKIAYSTENYTHGTQLKTTESIIGTSYDTARTLWGGGWTMPSYLQFIELINLCEWTWTKLHGTTGFAIKGPNGKSIFLPASGCYFDSINPRRRVQKNKTCFYWSGDNKCVESNLEYDKCFSSCLIFDKYFPPKPGNKIGYLRVGAMCDGKTIRAVMMKNSPDN